ncbi:MAG TPA: ribosome assembly RNA-binding protein YhbY [Vicinamibacterales bacterium]|nr:ribosome assembly RNA-binding protein YhbY [Vicinamibacterales bacterium]
MPVALTPRERADLKARAHSLEPLLQIGQSGLTDRMAAELDRTLTAHELIKVKVKTEDRESRETLCAAICERTGATAVQRVGNVLILWRPRPDAPPEDDE